MDKDENFIKENSIIFKKYKIKKKLADGAFGDVYMGSCIENNEMVAIKVENRKIVKPLLETEAFFLYSLRGLGIPEVLSFGRLKNYNVLVEPLLDKSLFEIFNERRKRLALEDICLMSKQIIERIQWVHSKNIVHRDIKPDNFLIGKKDPNVIYLIDFGLSKKYKSSTTGKHIRFGFTGKLTGTVRFASANALRGGEQSRRDDLESIGYMIIFFMRGKLPWQGVTGVKKMERYLKIYKMKKNVTPEDLCKSLPKQMTEYMRYVKSLEFEQDPDYKYLRNLFTSLLKKIHDTNDLLLFSWIKLADIPNLKNPINPATRRDSPQSRLYRKIETKLKHERNTSSDNDSNQKSFQTCTTTINNINSNIKKEDSKNNNNKEGVDPDFEFKSKKEKSKEGLNTMVTNLNKTIDENIVDFGDDDKNKISSNDISPLHIKNNINITEKKKNNTVNDILDFKQERKNRQIQQNFSSFSTSVQKNKVLLKDKSEEIKVNNQEKNLILINIKEKMENKMKNNKIILIKKEKTEDNENNLNNNINEKNEKILNIPKDSENNNNDNNNNSVNVNNNENNNKNKEKDNEKHIEKMSQNININIKNQKNINSNKIENIDIPKNIQKKKNNILNNNDIYIKKDNNNNSLQIKDLLSYRNNNNNIKKENKTNEKLYKNIIIKDEGPIDNNRNKKKNMNEKNYQINIVNSSKNIHDINNNNNNMKIKNKNINTDINLLLNNKMKNKKIKNNNTYEKINTDFKQNKIKNLELLPKNSDEIGNENQAMFTNNDINKNNLKNIQKNLNFDKNSLNENINKRKKISNSVNVFQNNINNNNINNILFNNNLNETNNISLKNKNNLNNINENNNNDNSIKHQMNYASNNNKKNNIKMNNIEFNNNRQIRIVNRNRNPNRNNNINESLNNNNNSPNEKKNIDFMNPLNNSNNSLNKQNYKLIKKKSHGINMNNNINNNRILNNINNNNIYEQANNSTLRNNSKNNYQKIDTTNYVLNKRPSHNINRNMIYPFNNLNQVELSKRPSYNIKTNNNYINFNQLGVNKRPSYNTNVNVSNFLNGVNIPVGYTKIKKITNNNNINNQLINKIGMNNTLDLRKNFAQNQLCSNTYINQNNNTFENIRNMNNNLINQFNIKNNNINLNEYHGLQNKVKQDKFNNSLNPNLRSNAIIGKSNNIPNFQVNTPNQINNTMQFYGYRNI